MQPKLSGRVLQPKCFDREREGVQWQREPRSGSIIDKGEKGPFVGSTTTTAKYQKIRKEEMETN